MNTKYQIHDSYINAISSVVNISFMQLEKAPKRKVSLAHNQQVICIWEKMNAEDAPGFMQVTCYAVNPKGRQKKIAIYILAPVQ